MCLSRLIILSYDVASGSGITPCNKIDKPLVVYRFSGNVMTSITTLCTYLQNYYVFTPEMNLQSNLNVIWSIESNIRAIVLLNILNSLRKRDKMLGKPRILSLFPNLFNKFSASLAFFLFFPTCLINSIKHEHSCKILYLQSQSLSWFITWQWNRFDIAFFSFLVVNCEFTLNFVY